MFIEYKIRDIYICMAEATYIATWNDGKDSAWWQGVWNWDAWIKV